MADLRGLFYADDHRLWYLTEEEKAALGLSGSAAASGDGDGEPDTGGAAALCSEADWQSISERMQMDMETFSKGQGKDPGAMLQNLREVNRERYDYPTGQLRNFVERLLFPLDTYMVDENGQRVKFDHKPIQTGLIYTMNCPDWLMEKVKYPTLLGFTGTEIGRLCGYNEVLYSCDTYQFSDYSRYDCNMFPEEKKREQREKQFPVDLQNAYELGKRLVERSKAE